MFNFQYKLAVLVQTSNLEPAVTFCVWPVSTFVQRLSIIFPLFSGREASRCSGEYKINLCTLFFLSTKDGNSFFCCKYNWYTMYKTSHILNIGGNNLFWKRNANWKYWFLVWYCYYTKQLISFAFQITCARSCQVF